VTKILRLNREETASSVRISAADVSVSPYMAVLCIFFLAGAVIGCLTAVRIDGEQLEKLSQTFTFMHQSLQSGQIPAVPFLNAVFNAFLFHIVVYAFGVTVFGLAVAPAAIAIKGFFLSVTVTVFVKMLGWTGFALAAAALAPQAIIALPILFIIASNALKNSLSMVLKRGTHPGPFQIRLKMIAVTAAILLMTAVYEAYISPYILVWIS
jgi:stage II sporulation protein M